MMITKTYSFISAVLGILLISTPVFSQSESGEGQFLGAMETAYPDWFKSSFLELEEDVAEATEEGKRFAIIFVQNGCPYCNALIEKNFSQKDIVDKTQKHLDITTINIWGDRTVTDFDGKVYSEKTYAQMMKVQFTPTILFFDEQQNIALRINGYHRPDIFSLELDYIIGKHEKTTAYRDFMVQNKDKLQLTQSESDKTLSKDKPLDIRANLKANKPFAVFFEQTECPACTVLHEEVLTDPSVKSAMKGFNINRVNMWGRKDVTLADGSKRSVRDWASELNIKYAPTIVLFNPEGEEVIRSEAYFKTFHTHSLFKYVATEAYRTEPSFQRYLSEYAEHMIEEGKDVNIWQTAKETN